MKRILVVATAFVCLSLPARPGLFDQLQFDFAHAAYPQIEDVRGYWSGRCTHWQSPNQIWPSFYVYRSVERPGSGEIVESQSYYVEHSYTSNKFDFATAEKIEQDPTLNAWKADQDWSPVFEQYGSLTNRFFFPGFPPMQREARIFHNPQGKWILLRIAPSGGGLPARPYTMCYYQRFLGLGTQASAEPTPTPVPSPVPTPVPSPTPAPSPVPSPTPAPSPIPTPTPSPIPTPVEKRFPFGSIDNPGEQLNQVVNQNPGEKINHLVFVHHGNQPIQIRSLRMSAGNFSLGYGETFTLQPGVEKEIVLGTLDTFSSLRFRVKGRSQRVQIFGVRTQ